MQVKLTAPQIRIVEKLLSTGDFNSPQDVIVQGLKRLEFQRRNEKKNIWLKQEIQKGLDDIENGRVISHEDMMKKLRSKLQRMRMNRTRKIA